MGILSALGSLFGGGSSSSGSDGSSDSSGTSSSNASNPASSAAGAALGGLAGYLGNTTAARTGTTASTGTSGGSSASTFSPLQTAMQGSTAGALQNFITNGPNLTPAMTTGTDAINSTYKGIGDRLQQSLASRGFGNSGASGTAALQTEVGRAGAVGGLQGQLQTAAQQQQLQALGQASNFAFAAPGQTYTGSTSANGTYTTPGSAAAGGIAGAAPGILQLLQSATGL